ncbi:MAG: PAS domain S-box protein [Anaerolineae bacterium]
MNAAAAALVVVALLLLALSLLAGPASWSGTPAEASRLNLSLFAVVIAMTIVYLLNRFVSPDAAGSAFVITLLIATVLSDEPRQLTEGRSLLSFALPILAASVLLRPRASLLVAVACSAVLWALSHSLGEPMPNFPAMATLFILAVLSWLWSRYLPRARADLTVSEERFRGIFQASPIPIAIYDAAGNLVQANQADLDVFGMADEPGLAGVKLFAAENLPDEMKETLRQGRPVHAELTYDPASARRAGRAPTTRSEIAHIDVHITPLAEEAGGGFLAQTLDVTEQRRAEEALRRERDFARSLIDTAPVTVAVLSPDGKILTANRHLQQLSGYSQEELVGRDWLEALIPERLHAFARAAHTQTAASVGVAQGTSVMRTKAGEELETDWFAKPLADSSGALTGVLVVGVDMTERRQAERARAAMQAIAQAAQEGADLPSVCAEIHASVRKLMPAGNFYVALREEQADLVSFPYFVDAADGPSGVAITLEPAAPTGVTGHILQTGDTLLASEADLRRLRDEQGVPQIGTMPHSYLGVPLKATPGEAIGVIAVQSYDGAVTYTGRDRELLEFASQQIAMVLQRRKAQDKLRESEQMLASIFRETPSVITVTRLDDGTFLAVNGAFTLVTGYTSEEAVGRTTAELRIWADLVDRDRFLQAAREGRAKDLEMTFVGKDGHKIVTVLSGTLVRLNGVSCLLSAITDLTEHRQLQEQLAQSQKMETIGRLAGGIAHDFNNLLTAISGHAAFAMDELAPGDSARGDIEEVVKAADRAAALTRQLLAFSRRQIIEPKVLDLNSLITDLDRMLRRVIGEDVTLETLPAAGLWPVRADRSQVEQVLVNLAVNARDAMRDGGRLTIETGNVSISSEYMQRRLDAPAGDYVMLAVSDTGIGLTPEVRQHLFEPFFTTKGIGAGTGLGLATVYGIVKQHNGDIHVYSEPGTGTTFRVYLPRATSPVEASVEGSSEGGLPMGWETVLLAEDEPMVRAVAVRVLGGLGYKVLEAATAEDDVRIASDHDGIHLLLTDVVMPQMSGRELARRIAAVQPGMRVLYTSGYTDNAIVHHGVLDDGVQFLPKPFTAAALARKVRAVLDLTPATRGSAPPSP